MTKKYKMTQKELERKKLELEKYEKELRALQKRITVSSTFGIDYDTGANAEMLQAAAEQEPLNQRIAELRDEIDNVEIVTIQHDSNKVGYGAVVIVNFIYDDDEIEENKLLISSTKIASTEYSVCSPSGPLYPFLEGKEKGYHGRCIINNNEIHVEYDFEILDVYYPANQK